MQWLSVENGIELVRASSAQMQNVLLPSQLADFEKEAPPPVVEDDAGSKHVTRRWFAAEREQPLIFEHEESPAGDRMLLMSPFRTDRPSDWTIIEELWNVPKWLGTRTPLFIQSRQLHPRFVVTRPSPLGWDAPIYAAGSKAEASSLLKILYRDAGNRSCAIQKADNPGDWEVFQIELSRGTPVARYADRISAFQFASRATSQFGVALVQQVGSPTQFYLSRGRMDRAETLISELPAAKAGKSSSRSLKR